MNVEQAHIGQIVTWTSSLTNEGRLYGHIIDLALNCVGEVIAVVKVAVYTSLSGERVIYYSNDDNPYEISEETRQIHFSSLRVVADGAE